MQKLPSAVALVLAMTAAGCSDSTGPGERGEVVLQLATAGSGAAAAPGVMAAEITLGGDVLVITDVQLVARKLKLERDDGNCEADQNAESEADDSEAEDEDECAALHVGPLLLDPPITPGAASAFTVDLPAGTYDAFQMQIHKPTGSADQAFLTAHPEFANASIIVTGTWNGVPFTFTTALTTVVEVELEEPVEVVADGTTELTLLLDVDSWFLAQGGLSLINPNGLSQQNRSLIEQNIRQSFKVFEDEDSDGDET